MRTRCPLLANTNARGSPTWPAPPTTQMSASSPPRRDCAKLGGLLDPGDMRRPPSNGCQGKGQLWELAGNECQVNRGQVQRVIEFAVADFFAQGGRRAKYGFDAWLSRSRRGHQYSGECEKKTEGISNAPRVG